MTVLVDSNVLVALSDERDALHRQAARGLNKLSRATLVTTEAVLCETSHLLPAPALIGRLVEIIDSFEVRPLDSSRLPPWADVFAWMLRYAEHDPGWTDAQLAVLCGLDRKARLWTYDREFRTVWRRPDGTRIPMAPTD